MRVSATAAPARKREARLTLLNAFELMLDGRPVTLPAPCQRVLAFLALQDHPLLRGYVAGTLWIDSTDDRALGSLRSALWSLRHRAPHLVEAAIGQLRLAPDVVVDLHEAVGRTRRLIEGTVDPEEEHLDETLLHSELLPAWYDDWVVFERERFHELRLRALESLCARLTAVGRIGEAMEAGLAAVKGEPLRESAHRALIGVHLAEGNHAEALRRYRWFERLMRDEFGLAPSEQMAELVHGLMTQ